MIELVVNKKYFSVYHDNNYFNSLRLNPIYNSITR